MKFDGGKGVKDLRFKQKHQVGLFYRQDGLGLQHSQLVVGSLNRKNKDNVGEDDIGTLEGFYDKEPDALVIRN